MRGAAVLEEKDALPGAEGHFSVDDRDHFAGAGECHADVTRHVIGAFVGVGEPGSVFGNKAFEKFFEVMTGFGIGIFHDDEAGAGVRDKNGDRALGYTAACHQG